MIPKLIHQIWLGDKPMLPLMVEWSERWKNLNPSWKVLLWHEIPGANLLWCEGSGWLVDGLTLEQASLLAKACHLSQRTNIWRYLLVKKFGGLYVDTDVEPFKPIDDLVRDFEGFAARRQSPYQIRECAFFGAVPNHPWVRQLVAELPTCDPTATLSMGTSYFTRIIGQHPEVAVLPENEVLFRVPDDWCCAKREAKLPESGLASAPPEAYAQHHWSSIWFPEGFAPLKCS
jgi:mannosyltransferase OCH1-like enzyme